MNKLLYVNIGGVVFQIDETAYQKLDNYLGSIRRKYSTTPDGDEIIKDIEHRIAELMFDRVGERGAITEKYVDEIIATMGKPEEFESEEQTYQNTGYSEPHSRSTGTKFYRDKENNVLGGVCAGFGAKIGVDSLWIRLAFLAFFFLAGTGFLLYIILWIIIPEAKTTAEKLEMRGEKVDINNIEKTVKDGAKQFGKKVNAFGEEVKQTFSQEHINRTKKNTGDFIEDAASTLKPLFQGIAKIFVFGVLLVSLAIVVATTVELFTNWGNNFTEIEFFGNHITEGSDQAWLLISCAVALLIIPFIGLIYSSVKFLLGIKQKTKFVGTTLSIFWVACLMVVIYLGITIGRNYRYEENISSKVTIAQPVAQTMHLQLGAVPADNEHHFNKWSVKKGNTQDDLIFQQISVEFEKSLDSNFAILVNKSARGYDRNNARENAQNLNFNIIQNGDSIIVVPAMIVLGANEKWREQEVDILIRVPQDKFIVIDKQLIMYIDKNEYTSELRDIELYNNKLKMTPVGLKPVY